MKKAVYKVGIITLLLFLILSSILLPSARTTAQTDHIPLQWHIVDTPSEINNVIVNPSEVNKYTIGPDGNTMYAVDVCGDLAGPYDTGKLYKSKDGGISWNLDITDNLAQDAGATLPVWDIAVAPDNENVIAAITSTGSPAYPKQIYFSSDGGDTWELASAGIDGDIDSDEYLSCIDISPMTASGLRYIAVGTRMKVSVSDDGTIFALKYTSTGLSTWADQSSGSSTGWQVADVIDVKFSPNYTSDSSIVALTSNTSGTHIYLGSHDLIANDTDWKTNEGYPVLVEDVNYKISVGDSPTYAQIITGQLDLPEDFLGSTSDMRVYYLCTDSTAANTQTGIYRIDDTEVHRINPATSLRVSSIDYYGTLEAGKLLAGEATVDTGTASAQVWRTETPRENAPVWHNASRPPTGGANSGYANAQVKWAPDGVFAYCGTSFADLSTSANWPLAYLTGYPLDESAFSISPCSPGYIKQLSNANKTIDTEVGDVWNQLSLIDTEITQLSDVVAIQSRAINGYNVLYLSSLNINGTVMYNIDSIWRSTTDISGTHWERILCFDSNDNGIVLRCNPRTHDEDLSIADRSNTIVIGDYETSTVYYSNNEGQSWLSPAAIGVPADVQTVDITVSNENTLHILSDNGRVYSATFSDLNWSHISVPLETLHTISAPMRNPDYEGEEYTYEDWIIVGAEATGQSAYIDLHADDPSFTVLPVLPISGDTHIIFDEQFQSTNYIYAASTGPGGNSGKIFRWEIDKSSEWDNLRPLNNAFYGLAQRNTALYGLWQVATPPDPPPGSDRTLDPRVNLIRPPEWDSLIEGLPELGDANYPVQFTHEPQALQLSSDGINNRLWTIDNRGYLFSNEIGCLWMYEDSMVTVGPWTTSPFSGQFLPVDPVTGRADEINFRWRQLIYGHGYQFQLSKDEDFSLMMIDNSSIVPPDPLSPSWIYYPDNIPSLEANHTFFWRVRARSATTGEIIRSPWSATMYFTVNAGLPVTTAYLGPQLLSPVNDCGCRCNAPVCFSWSPFKETTAYRFQLSENADMSSSLVSVEVPTTAYRYDGLLKCNTNYFWRVMSVKPYYSEWSPTFSFMTRSEKGPTSKTYFQTNHPIGWLLGTLFIYLILLTGIIILVRKYRSG